jgi:hypothetical protein
VVAVVEADDDEDDDEVEGLADDVGIVKFGFGAVVVAAAVFAVEAEDD